MLGYTAPTGRGGGSPHGCGCVRPAAARRMVGWSDGPGADHPTPARSGSSTTLIDPSCPRTDSVGYDGHEAANVGTPPRRGVAWPSRSVGKTLSLASRRSRPPARTSAGLWPGSARAPAGSQRTLHGGRRRPRPGHRPCGSAPRSWCPAQRPPYHQVRQPAPGSRPRTARRPSARAPSSVVARVGTAPATSGPLGAAPPPKR